MVKLFLLAAGIAVCGALLGLAGSAWVWPLNGVAIAIMAYAWLPKHLFMWVRNAEEGSFERFAFLPTFLGNHNGKKLWVWFRWYKEVFILDGEASFVCDHPVGDLIRSPLKAPEDGFTPAKRFDVSLAGYYRKDPDAWDLI